jgi:N-hydroxyarylamine O-acetyltransferase
MDIDHYLARIGLNERPAPNLAGLTAMHRAHLLAIPYENFDVQLGRRVTTDVAAIFDKIVTRRRGGWCYEMNGVFGWALGELGFRVTRATGSVMRVAAGEASDGNHLVLKVELPEGLFLADVGFADGPHDPIPLVEGPFESHGYSFGVARVDERWWRMNNRAGGAAPSFDFNLDPADEALLSAKCHELQTAASSKFVQNALAFRHLPEGYVALRGRTVTRQKSDGSSESRLIDSAEDLVATLAQDFALNLPEAADAWPRIVARHEQVMAEKAAAAAPA